MMSSASNFRTAAPSRSLMIRGQSYSSAFSCASMASLSGVGSATAAALVLPGSVDSHNRKRWRWLRSEEKTVLRKKTSSLHLLLVRLRTELEGQPCEILISRGHFTKPEAPPPKPPQP